MIRNANNITFLSAFLFFFSCGKEHENPLNKLPHAKIIISSKVAATNIYDYYGKGERYNSIDSLVQDSTFYMTKNPDGSYYYKGIQLFLNAQFDTSLYTASFLWKVGLDPTIKSTQSFNLFFEEPYNDLQVRLITNYTPKSGNSEIKLDTVYQTIHIYKDNPIIGEYQGINTDSTKDTFNIKVGWQYDADPRINRTYFAVSNLPKNFPIKNEVQVFSASFGVTGETFLGEDIFYNGEYVNTIYALSFLNKNHDSITIHYNYGIIIDRTINSNDWSKVIQKTFIGKKIQ